LRLVRRHPADADLTAARGDCPAGAPPPAYTRQDHAICVVRCQQSACHFIEEVCAMTKSHHATKETKKKAALTPKEKKSVKREKKHAGETVPLITPRS
jgi:hypothetical protein